MIRTIAGAFNTESTFQQGSWARGMDSISIFHDQGSLTSIVQPDARRGATFDQSADMQSAQMSNGAQMTLVDPTGATSSLQVIVSNYFPNVVAGSGYRQRRLPKGKPLPPITTSSTTTSSTTPSPSTAPPTTVPPTTAPPTTVPPTTAPPTTVPPTTAPPTTTTSTTTPGPTTPPPTTAPPPPTTQPPTTAPPPPVTTSPP